MTRQRAESRTREVEDPATGEKQVQSYTVQVPYTENVTQAYTVLVGYSERIEVPLQDAKFWTVAGKALTTEEAQEALSSTKRCVIYSPPPGKSELGYPGSPFFAEMLNKDVLVIWYQPPQRTETPAVKAPSEKKEGNPSAPATKGN